MWAVIVVSMVVVGALVLFAFVPIRTQWFVRGGEGVCRGNKKRAALPSCKMPVINPKDDWDDIYDDEEL